MCFYVHFVVLVAAITISCTSHAHATYITWTSQAARSTGIISFSQMRFSLQGNRWGSFPFGLNSTVRDEALQNSFALSRRINTPSPASQPCWDLYFLPTAALPLMQTAGIFSVTVALLRIFSICFSSGKGYSLNSSAFIFCFYYYYWKNILPPLRGQNQIICVMDFWAPIGWWWWEQRNDISSRSSALSMQMLTHCRYYACTGGGTPPPDTTMLQAMPKETTAILWTTILNDSFNNLQPRTLFSHVLYQRH